MAEVKVECSYLRGSRPVSNENGIQPPCSTRRRVKDPEMKLS